MFFEVKIYNKNGKLKKILPPKELTINFWRIHTVKDLKAENKIKKIRRV